MPTGWPHGWEVYYVVFLAAGLSLLFPLLLWAGARFVGSSKPKRAQTETENRLPTDTDTVTDTAKESVNGRKINTRVFLGGNTAIVLISLALMLVPCVSALRSAATRGDAIRGLIAILSLAGFATLGLLYSASKGDLNWLDSFRRRGKDSKS